MTHKTPIITLLLLITAVCLSGVAAFYSIAGLVAIFASAAIPVIVMGSILEVSKLVVSSWLYRNWQVTPRAMKYYFCSAIMVLMLLTSMGIFGFLSKAHVDQNLVSGDVVAKLSLIDEKIKIEKENIDANRKIITQLDQAVDQTLGRSTDESGAARSAALRRSQTKDRQAAQKEILSSQAKVDRLNEDKAPIAAQVRSVEAEVGPVKYIAQLIYGQEATDSSTLEKAVRLVILMIVFAFDPLAVLMFIAVNQDMKRLYPKGVIEDNNDSLGIQDIPPVTEDFFPDVEYERDRKLEPVKEVVDIWATKEDADLTYHLHVDDQIDTADQASGERTHTDTGIGNVKF